MGIWDSEKNIRALYLDGPYPSSFLPCNFKILKEIVEETRQTNLAVNKWNQMNAKY